MIIISKRLISSLAWALILAALLLPLSACGQPEEENSDGTMRYAATTIDLALPDGAVPLSLFTDRDDIIMVYRDDSFRHSAIRYQTDHAGLKQGDSYPLPSAMTTMLLHGDAHVWRFSGSADPSATSFGGYDLYADDDLLLSLHAGKFADKKPFRCQMLEYDGILYTYFEGRVTIGERLLPLPEIDREDRHLHVRGLVQLENGIYALATYIRGEDTHLSTLLIPLNGETQAITPQGTALDCRVIDNLVETYAHQGYFISENRMLCTDGQQTQVLFDLPDLGVQAADIFDFTIGQDGSVYLLREGAITICRLSSSPQDATQVTVACIDGNPDFLSDAVAAYNARQTDYRVKLKEYPDTGKLNLALLSGEIDMIISADVLTLRNYVAHGQLADLETMLPELYQPDALVENIVDAARISGVSYFLPRTFYVIGFAASDTLLNGNESTDPASLLSLLAGRDSFLRSNTQMTWFHPYTSVALDRWIDWNERRAHFTDADFMEILAFCNQGAIDEEEAAAHTANREFFGIVQVHGALDMIYFESDTERGRGKRTLLPYPLADHAGYAIQPSILLSVTSNAPCQSGAVDFMTYVFLEAAFPASYGLLQNELPLNQAAMLRLITGQSHGQEQYDLTVQTIACADHYAYGKENALTTIVREESARYFSGEITVDQAVAYIQNRVQLYLDEQG